MTWAVVFGILVVLALAGFFLGGRLRAAALDGQGSQGRELPSGGCCGFSIVAEEMSMAERRRVLFLCTHSSGICAQLADAGLIRVPIRGKIAKATIGTGKRASMVRIGEKRVTVDLDQLAELARLMGVGESEAVQKAIEQALAVEQANAEIRAYQQSDAFKRARARLGMDARVGRKLSERFRIEITSSTFHHLSPASCRWMPK